MAAERPNRTRTLRFQRRQLAALHSYGDYHRLLFDDALERYGAYAAREKQPLGTVLALGATGRDARHLRRHPFDRIVLSGVAEPDDETQEICERDGRVSYRLEDAEALDCGDQSFDLVFCKEALHHLARPVAGLYEMLRVCRLAALLVEPWACPAVALLDRLGATTRYEHNQHGNLRGRDNHVYRWTRAGLLALLRSLYLESGFELEIKTGWLSTRAQVGRPVPARTALALAAAAAAWLPGASGNLASILIAPGADRPG